MLTVNVNEMVISSENEDFNILDFLIENDIDFEKVTFEIEFEHKEVRQVSFTKQELYDMKRGDI